MQILHVPTRCLQSWTGEPRHVLVELKAHTSSRNRHDSLVRKFCREGERRRNVLWPK
jgi:hypothetical protein